MMEGWKKVRLGDFANITMGQSPPSKDYNSEGRGLPFYQGKTEFGEYYPSIAQYSTSGNKKAENGDILFTVRAPVGELNISNCHCIIGRGLASIRAKENKHQRFLYYLLKISRTEFESRSYGAVYDAINAKDLKNSELLIPKEESLIEKIASILTAYDDLIENNLKRIKLLGEKAQLTYEEWFVRMKFPGHETTPINKETGLPEGWEKKKINEIADFQNGYAFYTKGYSDYGYAVIDLANVSEWGDLNITGKEKFISEELYESLPKFHLQKYDIIIAMTDVTSALRILAKSAIIDKDNTYALNQRVGMLRPNTDLFDYSFLYALLGDIRFIERMKAMSKGAVQFYFNTKDIVNYETFVPSKEIIDEFVKQYKPILELRMKLKDQNKSLKEARDILLPRLMTGMIDVEQMNLENLQPTNA